MERYRTSPEFSDDDLQLPIPEQAAATPLQREEWWLNFQYDQYDWNDPEFAKRNVGKFAYAPIKLTQGYFAMVSARRYKSLSKFKWHALILRDVKTGEIVKIYAARTKPNTKGGKIYMHRQITGSGSARVTDHINGYGLDNRDPNIRDVSSDINNSNAVRVRKKHPGLPTGINKKGCKYQARVSWTSKGRQQMEWETFESLDEAVAWREKKRAKLHNCSKWATTLKASSQPFFPPRWEEEPEIKESKKIAQLDKTVQDLAATF